MLILHGSRDQASPVTDIYNYTRELDNAANITNSRYTRGDHMGSWLSTDQLSRMT